MTVARLATDERIEHIVGDGRGAKSLEFPVRTTAEPIVEASTTSDCRSPKCIVASPTDPLSVSV